MSYHDWWVISLVVVLILFAIGAIIGGVLAAQLAIRYIYGDKDQKSSSVSEPYTPSEEEEDEEIYMEPLNGPISDRLRKMFKKDDPIWFPPRDHTTPKKTKLPKGVEGHSLGGRNKGKKK